MRVFVTGATGYIGSAVVDHLGRNGHEIRGLARTPASAARLEAQGHRAVIGDMAEPGDWLPQIEAVEAVIHTAATFDDRMAETEALLLDGLLRWAERRARESGNPVPFVYTGGCWLYGPVGDNAAVEGAPFDPLAGFSFMVAHRQRLLDAVGLRASVVHPAMVWDETGGAIAGFIESANAGQAPRIYGAADLRWPLVHRDDLAALYVRVLEAGRHGADYHGVGESGTRVWDIAAAIARKHGAPEPDIRPVAEAVAAYGASGAGLALDQTMAAPATQAALNWAPAQPSILEAVQRA